VRARISLFTPKPQILSINCPYHVASMIYRSIQRGDSTQSLFKIKGNKELLEIEHKMDFGKQNSKRFRMMKVTE